MFLQMLFDRIAWIKTALISSTGHLEFHCYDGGQRSKSSRFVRPSWEEGQVNWWISWVLRVRRFCVTSSTQNRILMLCPSKDSHVCVISTKEITWFHMGCKLNLSVELKIEWARALVCILTVCPFSGSSKQEEATELYVRAANTFKMAKKWGGIVSHLEAFTTDLFIASRWHLVIPCCIETNCRGWKMLQKVSQAAQEHERDFENCHRLCRGS